jgi:hypothetical protein
VLATRPWLSAPEGATSAPAATASDALRKDTGWEWQDQVPETRLDCPVHDAPDAVQRGVVGQRSVTTRTAAPVITSGRPKSSNGGRRHAISPTAIGTPTATVRAAVSLVTVVDDAAVTGTSRRTRTMGRWTSRSVHGPRLRRPRYG